MRKSLVVLSVLISTVSMFFVSCGGRETLHSFSYNQKGPNQLRIASINIVDEEGVVAEALTSELIKKLEARNIPVGDPSGVQLTGRTIFRAILFPKLIGSNGTVMVRLDATLKGSDGMIVESNLLVPVKEGDSQEPAEDQLVDTVSNDLAEQL